MLCLSCVARLTCAVDARGNTIEAMSGAIDSAEIVLYGVSQKYKESANVRVTRQKTPWILINLRISL